MSSLVGGNPWGPGLRLTLQVGLILPFEVLWVGLSKCCQTNRTHLGQPLSVALIRVTGGVAYPPLVGKLPQDPLGLPCVGLQELQLGSCCKKTLVPGCHGCHSKLPRSLTQDHRISGSLHGTEVG